MLLMTKKRVLQKVSFSVLLLTLLAAGLALVK